MAILIRTQMFIQIIIPYYTAVLDVARSSWQRNRKTGSQARFPFYWNIRVPIHYLWWHCKGTPRFSHLPILRPDWPFRDTPPPGCRHGYTPPAGATIPRGGGTLTRPKAFAPICHKISLWPVKWGHRKSASVPGYSPHDGTCLPLFLSHLTLTRHAFIANFGHNRNRTGVRLFHQIHQSETSESAFSAKGACRFGYILPSSPGDISELHLLHGRRGLIKGSFRGW